MFTRPIRSRTFNAARQLACSSLVGASILAGCVGDPDALIEADEEPIGQSEQSLLRKLDFPKWGSTVRVCFSGNTENHAKEMRWVRDLATSTWGRYAKIDFTGFGTCSATVPTQPELEIKIQDVTENDSAGAQAQSYGAYTSRQSCPGRFCGIWVGWSKNGSAPRARVGSQVVHELGHALGFAHDQNSLDNPTGECWADAGGDPTVPNIEAGSIMTIGAYDPLSIMNYCADKQGPLLSPGDKVNIGTVYGARALDPGKSDVVWSAPSTSQLAVWKMNGTTPSTRGAGITVPTGYTLLGTGNFAGYSVLFRDASNQLIAWKLSGTSYAGYRIVTGASVTTPARRTVVATGDMDGDRITDVIWKDTTTGQYGVWMMDDGPTIRGESPFHLLNSGVLGRVPDTERLVGVGDFDGDGGGEILWQNTSTRALTLWQHFYTQGPGYPTGSVIRYGSFDAAGLLPLASEVAAIGDFDGDGVSDLAWSHPNGNLVVSLIKRSRMFFGQQARLQVKATMNIPLTNAPAVVGAPVDWKVAGTGDFDGDGTTDLLWRSTLDGRVGTSPMSGGGVRDVPLRGFGGKCLTTNGYTSANGTGLILWDCVGQDNQKWTLRSDGTLRGLGGKCVSSNGDTIVNGTGLVLWDCLGQENQKWTLGADGVLRGIAGKAISTSGYTSANGTNLVLWTPLGQENQKWTVAAVVAPTTPFATSAKVAGTLGRDPTPR